MVSIISKFGSDRSAAAQALRASGMPVELLQQTGDSALTFNLAYKSPFGCVVTDMYEVEGGLVAVSLTVSGIRKPDGHIAAFGEVNPKDALAQKEENPTGAAQWWGLNFSIVIPIPVGKEAMFEAALAYFPQAKRDKVPLAQRKEECKIWLWGTLVLSVAPGGKYGCVVDDVNVYDVTWNGDGSGSEPIVPSSLVAEHVEDVSDLFGFDDAPGASSATSPTVVAGTRRTASRR